MLWLWVLALSLTVPEILTFLGFPQKSKMAAKSGEKIEIFQFSIGYFAITLWVKNSVKITLSLAVSEILTFSVFRKNPRWPPKVAKLNRILSPYPVGQKFSRNRSISYGFPDINIFCFSAKIQDGRKSGENWNFSIAHRILYHYDASQNFCGNGSISYGFRDINIFCFSAKIQDGRQKWRKLKFFNFV